MGLSRDFTSLTIIFLIRSSIQKMESTGCVNMKFIVFLKTTLGKMVATKTLDSDFINLDFWQKWPQKFYSIKSYDGTKQLFESENAAMENPFGSDDDDDDDEEEEEEDDQKDQDDKGEERDEQDTQLHRDDSISILDDSQVNTYFHKF